MSDMIALLLIGGLAVIPLAWRARQDRLDEAALQVQAEVQATANRVFGGESLLMVAVTAPSLRRAGQVRLSAPAGWECLIESVWPRIMAVMPQHYELVVEANGPAMPEHRHALSAA